IAENGAERSSGDDYACTAGVRVLAGGGAVAPGWIGIVLGAADVPALERRLAEALERAYRRAMANAEHKATAREKFGPLGDALADLRLHAVDVRSDVVPAVYRIDPRSVPLADMVAVATDVSRAIAAALPTSEREVVVVTDPHYNTLVSHEIVGHPAELDRALKMETAYAGRSWLLADLDAHQVGRRIASPLVTAYSDPALPGYGHYAYDHEGTPARRVTHIDRGVFRGFMNSRQTAAVFGGEPNGHFKATSAALVPLIRMSNTVFDGGDADPARVIGDVDRGYYLVGHRIPSIAESRENFRISARKVYAIERGEITRLYRDGGIAADTRDYLMKVDAVGRDFRLYPIPNCGKGQPMQSKKLGNGGPTMRSRARVLGG